MISLDEIALKVDGEIAGAELKGVNAKKAEIKIGRMNLLISDVIASLDEDRVKIVDIVRDYIEHGRKAYGDKFPANELEIKEPR
ncbi:hypothetical protein PAA8504_00266 [Palleronia abyssalis]|uniref:Uncharacterized protein n=2 Tax=Palleronia abyssalis TaxID=1501240 RepID=A0A2R8BQM6_9RHOB|nr:hypothetical protein PAA8504_00266 [Palleronia abyssalis]